MNDTIGIRIINIMNELKKFPKTHKELFRLLEPELKELLFKQWGAKQNPKYHPEGNTLKHIFIVVKRAFIKYPNDPNMIMTPI